MKNNRAVIIGLSGFFAGAIAASLLNLPPLPKAAIVAGVSLLVAVVVWAFSRWV